MFAYRDRKDPGFRIFRGISREQEQIMLKEIDKMYEQLQSKKQVQSLKGGRRRKKVVSCRKKVVSRRRKVVSRRKKGKKNKSKKMKR